MVENYIYIIFGLAIALIILCINYSDVFSVFDLPDLPPGKSGSSRAQHPEYILTEGEAPADPLSHRGRSVLLQTTPQ